MLLIDLITKEQDRSNARALANQRIAADAMLQAQSHEFQSLLHKEKLLAEFEAGEKNRNAQFTIAELKRVSIEFEGSLNRELQEKLAEISRISIEREGSLDRELKTQLENVKLNFKKWSIHQRKDLQVKIKEKEAHLAKQLRVYDRETELKKINKKREVNSLPICLHTESILGRSIEEGLQTIHIFYSPPIIKREESQFNPNLPLFKEEHARNIRNKIISFYEKNGRPVMFYGGAWLNKDFHGESAINSVFNELKTEPTILLEAMVEDKKYDLNLGSWVENAVKANFLNLMSINWQETLNAFVKKRIIEWREKGLSEAELKSLLGEENYSIYKRNLELCKFEEAVISQGFRVKSFKRSYETSEDDIEKFSNYISSLNCLYLALKIDEYFLLYTTPSQRKKPLLPEIIHTILHDMPVDKAEQLSRELVVYYTELYRVLSEREDLWSPEIKLEFARILSKLNKYDLADEELMASLKKFVTINFFDNTDKTVVELKEIIELLPLSVSKKSRPYLLELISEIEELPSSKLSIIHKNLTQIMNSKQATSGSDTFILNINRVNRLYKKAIKIIEKEVKTDNKLGLEKGANLLKSLYLYHEQCRAQTFKVAIMALMKSGKSTFINSLLIDELLPMSNAPATGAPVRIIHTVDTSGPVLKDNNSIVADTSSKIYSYIEEINEKIRKYEIKVEDTDLVLNANVKVLEGKEMENIKFEILDTPGYGEAQQEIVGKKSIHESNEELLDTISVVIYLLDYTKLKSQSEEEVLTKLSLLRPDLLENIQERLFFVVNKIDLENSNALSPEETIEYVYNVVKTKVPRIEKSQIFTISANNAYLARIIASGKADDGVIDDFGIKAFGDNYKRKKQKLSPRKLKEELLNEAHYLLEDSNILKVEENVLDFIYTNRGALLVDTLLDNLDRLVKDFKNKFILTAQGTLQTSMIEIEKLEKRIANAKKNQNAIDEEAEAFKISIKNWIRHEFEEFEADTVNQIESALSGEEEIENDNLLRPNKKRTLFEAIIKRISSTPRSTTKETKEEIISKDKLAVREKVKKLYEAIHESLKEVLTKFNSELELKILLKQKDLFSKLEVNINQVSREFETVIGKTFNISLTAIPLKMDRMDIGKIFESLNQDIDQIINPNHVSDGNYVTKYEIIEERVKNPKKSWLIEFWKPSYIIETRSVPYEEWIDKSYTNYEVKKDVIKQMWAAKIREWQEEISSFTEEIFIEKQIKLLVDGAKEKFNEYVNDYLSTIQLEREKFEIGGDGYLGKRLKELEDLSAEVNDILFELREMK